MALEYTETIAHDESGEPTIRVVEVTGLADGEPFFVVRGNDATAVPLLNLYSAMLEGVFPEAEKAESLELGEARRGRARRGRRGKARWGRAGRG